MPRTRAGAGVPQQPTADFREEPVAPQASHLTTQEGQQAQVPTEGDIDITQPLAARGGSIPDAASPKKEAAAAPQGSLPPVPRRASNDDAERRFLRTATRIVLAGTSSSPPAPSSSASHGADPTVEEVEEATEYLMSRIADGQLWPPWLRPGSALLLVKLLAVALRRADTAELATRHRIAFLNLAAEVLLSFVAVGALLDGPGGVQGQQQQQLMAKQFVERVAQAMVRSGAFQCLGRLAAASPSLGEYDRSRDALLAAACGFLHHIADLAKHWAESARIIFPPAELVAALADSHLLEHLAQRTLLTDTAKWQFGDKLLRAFMNLNLPPEMGPHLHSHGLPGPCMQFVLAAAVVSLLQKCDGRSMYGLPEFVMEVFGSPRLMHGVDVFSVWLKLQLLDESGFPANGILSPAASYELSMRICAVCTNLVANAKHPPPPPSHEPSPVADSRDGGDDDAAGSGDGAGGSGSSSGSSSGKSPQGGGGVLAGENAPMAAASTVTSSVERSHCFTASSANDKSSFCSVSLLALMVAHGLKRAAAPPTPATATSTLASTSSSTAATTADTADAPANTAPGAATAASTTAAVAIDTAEPAAAAATAAIPAESDGGGPEAAAAAEEEQECSGRGDTGWSLAAGSLIRSAGWWEATTRALRVLASLVPELAMDELNALMVYAGALVQNYALGRGQLSEELPARLPAEPPPDVAAALTAGLVPALEQLLRRGIILGPGTVDFPPGYLSLLAGVVRWPQMGWLMAYGNPRQVAALVATLGKVIHALGVRSALPYHFELFTPIVLGMNMVQKGLVWGARSQLPLQQPCQPQRAAASGTLAEGRDDESSRGTRAGSAGGGCVSGSGVSNGRSGVSGDDGGDDGRDSNAGSGGCQPARVADPPAAQLLRLLTFAFQTWLPTWSLIALLRMYDVQSRTPASTSRHGCPPPPPLEPANYLRDMLRMVGLALDQLDQLAAATRVPWSRAAGGQEAAAAAGPPKARVAAGSNGVAPPPATAASAAAVDWVWLLTEQAEVQVMLCHVAEVTCCGCIPASELEPLRRVCYQMLTHCGPAMGAVLRGRSGAGLKPVQAFNSIFGPKGSNPDKRLMDLLRGARDAGASTSGSPPPPVTAAPPPPSPQSPLSTAPPLPPLAEVRALQRTCVNLSCSNLYGSSEADLEFRPYDSGGKEARWLCGLPACKVIKQRGG